MVEEGRRGGEEGRRRGVEEGRRGGEGKRNENGCVVGCTCKKTMR